MTSKNETVEPKGTVAAFQIDKDTKKVETLDNFTLVENGQRVYSPNNKPTASDVGAVSTSGGRMSGKLQIYGASSQLEIIENDQSAGDKVWRMEGQANNLDFTESGVATRLRLKAGGGAVISGALDVTGHVNMGTSSILKFPTSKYPVGAQMYARDGGEYGANFVLNTGGNMVLGAGECGTALADIIGSAATEHAYIAADGDTHIISGANTIADRKVSRFAADGSVYLNEGSTLARTFYGSADTYVSRSGTNLYVAANGTNGKVYLEGKQNPIARVGTQDYTIYHSGNKPSLADVGGNGKAIGASTSLASGVDLNDYKTPGVYHQTANAGATAGKNYPEPLAGSLVVYLAAGIIQEYRVYNSSKLYRRGQYSTGSWTAWSSDFNSLNKPTAADVGALPLSGGTLTGPLAVTGSHNNLVNLDTTNSNGSYVIGKQSGVSDWYVGRANANKDVALISYSHGGHGLVIRADRTEFGKDLYVGSNRVFREGAQVVGAHRKSAFTMNNQASMSFQDGTNTKYHNYAEVGELKWSTGDDSAVAVKMALTPTGQLRVAGDFVSGQGISTTGNINANGGGSVLATGIFRTTRSDNPMVEWHKPGVSAYIQYLDAQNNLRIGTSNGAGTLASTVVTMAPNLFFASGKVQTNTNANRGWGAIGTSGLYVDNSMISANNGALQATTSIYTYLPNQYYGEFITGVLHGATWGETAQVLSGWNASANSRATWMFHNNGILKNPQGTSITSYGDVESELYDGTLTKWAMKNFADTGMKITTRDTKQSKKSALADVSKIKFYSNARSGVGVSAVDLGELDEGYVKTVETFGEEAQSVKALDTANLLALALKAIQELQAEVAELKAAK